MIFACSPRTSAALRIYMAVACGAGAAAWGHAASASDAGGPFGRFAGAWSGGGQVIGANGDRERIRCRANYAESGGGEAMTQTIVCASASYRINIESSLQASGGTVQGAWAETTRNVSGRLTGRLAEGRFQGMVTGPNFTAKISLSSNGKRQEVKIQPSAGDIADVSINLDRRG